MYISKFKIANYKSFLESPELEFTPGFNIISGQNNSGKTALLEALGLQFFGIPHRSLKTLPARDTIPDQTSIAHISFTLPPDEVRELLRAAGLNTFLFAYPDTTSPESKSLGYTDHSEASLRRALTSLFSSDKMTFNIQAWATRGNPISWVLATVPSFGRYPSAQKNPPFQYWHVHPDADGNFSQAGTESIQSPVDIGFHLAPWFQRHIYRFSAERLKIGRGPHGGGFALAQDAVNLPEVLNQLQRNPARFRYLNHQLNSILPQVRWVSVQGIGPGQLEIVAWTHDPESQREDLAVPLSESGTGIGQVLAILYVVMTSERPQTIIIDEPQSFLHPGAARKLVEFLKLHSHHQYIIATHSATIISATNPRTITLARFEDSQTNLRQLDAGAEKGIQLTLVELGIRLADSFGSDNILWVEGKTEEKCFPIIIEKVLKRPLFGTEILSIRQTGDLESKDAKKIFETYRSLTKGASLLPPAVAFVLDEECRDDAAKKELRKLSGDLAEFLPRRMYENYLLNPAAIAAVANSVEGFRSTPITNEELERAMEQQLGRDDCYCERKAAPNRSERLRKVDAARVLKELFSTLSNQRVAYEKIVHGIALTEWLVQHSVNDLKDISDLLSLLLDRAGAEENMVKQV